MAKSSIITTLEIHLVHPWANRVVDDVDRFCFVGVKVFRICLPFPICQSLLSRITHSIHVVLKRFHRNYILYPAQDNTGCRLGQVRRLASDMGACVSGGKWATWTCVIYSVAVIFLIPFCSGHAGHDHNHDHDHRHGGFVYKAEENNQPSAQHVHDGKKDIHIQPHAHDHHHHHHDHDHMHDHDHDHPDSEPPSFKYSKQANSAKAPAPPAPPSPSQPKAQQGQSSGSKAAKSAHAHSHSHSHPAGHSHGHAHGHDHGHSHAEGHDHGHSHPIPAPTKAFGTSQTWLYALGSTLGISIAPFVILFAIPISSNSPEHEPLLRVLLSFAAGGLLGDAFLHLIPHSIPHSHGHDHSDHNHGHEHVHQEAGHMVQTVVGAWVLAGIIAFFVVEKVIRHMKGGHHHGHGHTHLHGQSHESTSHNTQSHQHGRGDIKEEESQTHVRKEIKRNTSSSEEADLAPKNEEDKDYELVVRKRHREAKKTEETHAEPVKTQKSEERKGSTGEAGTRKETSSDIKIGGYLNLAADFAHNFTDGLAIGASYLAGQSIGMVTTFTILFHEVPHEIGDFALLVQSGCSKPKAMALQLVTALGAFTGCLVSLAFGSSEVEGKISWVLPFTAGGFIYIATVSVIPELLQESKISQTIKEVLGLLTGIGMMVAIAWIEEQQHHH